MLVVQNIRKHFGGLAAVDDTSFEVAQGTITSLIGPNGAGKTTLFNIISGLLRPNAGTVQFKGIDITGWSPQRIARAGMGRTFQNVQLFQNLNALENVIAARFCRSRWRSRTSTSSRSRTARSIRSCAPRWPRRRACGPAT